MTPYFEKILCSVVRKFILEVTLHRYLQTLRYTIVIVITTVTYCYCCSSFLTKNQNIRKNRNIKGALSGLRQFFGKWKSFKNDEKCIYFTSKALFVLKIFQFLPWLFGNVSKRLDYKVNLKFHDVTAWLTNICNTRIAQYLERSDFASHVCLKLFSVSCICNNNLLDFNRSVA